MRHPILFLALPLLLVATPCRASTLSCRADYDETSHYELMAPLGDKGLEGSLALRYVTGDGIDLHADLSPKTQAIVPGHSLRFSAENDSMGATLDASYDAQKRVYPGSLALTFDLEHAEPLALDVLCEIL